MGRFIVRFTGSGEPSADEVQRICSLPDLKLVDSSPRMLLIESPSPALRRRLQELRDWSVIPEQIIPLPDTRPKIRRR